MSKYIIDPDEKIMTVKGILDGKETQRHAAARLGVALISVQQWIANYQSGGSDAFNQRCYKRYPKELKEKAVLEYLNGEGSLLTICQKYGIKAKSKLQNWIRKYNSHEELKTSGTGGTTIMTKGRKTTFEERVEIVQYCISHDCNYAETAEKFKISYQQARSYTVKYKAGGIEALKDRRGRSKAKEEMTELDKLRTENKILRAEKERAEMEASFLKKLDAIEGVGLSLIRHEQVYLAIKTEHDEHGYPISALCKVGNISRAAYYKWLHREIPSYETENKRIADEIEKIHTESPDKGYRRIRDDLERYHDIKVNDKRVLRICRKKELNPLLNMPATDVQDKLLILNSLLRTF